MNISTDECKESDKMEQGRGSRHRINSRSGSIVLVLLRCAVMEYVSEMRYSFLR
jgi:hypothetical protein